LKKNGKRYRALEREKEQKKIKNFLDGRTIDQEVEEINISLLSVAHIVTKNPIVYDNDEVKKEYIKRLNSYIRVGQWNRKKFEKAELLAYEKIIMSSNEVKDVHEILFYKYYILLDVIQVLGYEIKSSDNDKFTALKEKYLTDFVDAKIDKKLVDKIFGAFKGSGYDKYKKLQMLAKNKTLADATQYVKLMLQNQIFKDTAPFGIMVTATMSAGKSTFINALTGKYICLSQNMACTSKIHNIVNKAFEDGYSYKYDHDLVMTAGREELLNDNELNLSDKIVVGTHFIGLLGDQRIVISDSPGVNYSGAQEHKLITDKLIKGRNYHLLIYVMNATQLGTNDESEHLDYIKRTVGKTPVIFVINKIDAFNVEEENLESAIRHQIEYLKKKGFKNPIVCPISARAGYLAKRFGEGGLSRTEQRELYNFVDKFEQMNLPAYYKKVFKNMKITNSEKEEVQLLKTCGLAYVEKIIAAFTTGGKINGTDLY